MELELLEQSVEENTLNHDILKTRQRAERDSFTPNLSIRVHRALSWLKKSEQCEDDDSRFTFLWIAFNAAYAQEWSQCSAIPEKDRYQTFIDKLVSIDKAGKLQHLVWDEYSGPIRCILENEFILQAFWEFKSGRLQEQEWRTKLRTAKQAANHALANTDTSKVLSIVFTRLYTLRNQIIHGGSTFGSSANRSQLRDCTNFLQKVIPIVIYLMMDGKNEVWGDPVYPLVNSM